MIVCNLTKPENTLDQVKKQFPNLAHTDAAQVAVALVQSGKYAVAHYEEQSFVYPSDVRKLTEALSKEIALIQTTVGETKKAKAAAAEEEPVEVKIGLTVNLEAGETFLAEREDLKTTLSDAIQAGVEFQYGPTDVLWQWALDRANWNTVSGGELARRVKLKAVFQDSVGTDLGAGGGKRKSRAAAPKPVETEEVVPE